MNFEIGSIPLYWRTKKTKDEHNPFPDVMPFAFGFDSRTGLIKENVSPELKKVLTAIYEADANIGYLQDGHDLANAYGTDFLRFVKLSLEKIQATSSFKILELGCGGGYMLRKLKESGFHAEGVDPSPIAQRAAQKYGLKVTQGFFPQALQNEKFDLIFHMDVFEHVENPIQFLSSHRESLKDGGWVIISIPDCTPSIEVGDLGMVIHQHVNFFDENSLRNTLALSGFEPILIERALVGGSLYALAKKTETAASSTIPVSNGRFEKFSQTVSHGIKKIREFVKEGTSPGNSVGFYVPLRASPYLGILNLSTEARLFDDDQGLKGRWLDGYDMPVENFQNLIDQPVTHLVVMSLSFGDKIEAKIRKQFGDRIKVVTLKNLFTQS